MSDNVVLPWQYCLDLKISRSSIRQLAYADDPIAIETEAEYRMNRREGRLFTLKGGRQILVFDRARSVPDDAKQVLVTKSGDLPRSQDDWARLEPKWLAPRPAKNVAVSDPKAVRDTWLGQFSFVEAPLTLAKDEEPRGLRAPQLGAMYAALAHWKVSEEPATIVMPTGTGKTETMLALLVHQQMERLLVVVPNDALRTQIADKFTSLGLLKRLGIVGGAAAYPIVGKLEHQLKTAAEVDKFFEPCNVIVTTMQVLSGCKEPAKDRIEELCSDLFIDEAHHVKAPTWDVIRHLFARKRILQFTATPFRTDRKHVEGTVIFNYPLLKAQEGGYFKRVRFDPVMAFNSVEGDRLIAEKAVATLRNDLQNNFDHLVMARTASVKRADEVLQAYQAYPDLNPVRIVNEMSEAEKREALAAIKSRTSRIVVCVNMFGEGFDLPELKVAALHDPHKSLAITLQFTGRFTRSRADLGEATVIANIAETGVNEALEELYAEDADWNVLLRDLSQGATSSQQRLSKFFKDFGKVPKQLPVQNVTPALSTVVYRTKCKAWRPQGIKDVVHKDELYQEPLINTTAKVAVFVTRTPYRVKWGSFRDLADVAWDLFILYWDEARGLLFINSTSKDLHANLAAKVAGSDVKRIQGEDVFRVLHGINQLTLTNLGLGHAIGRSTSFTMLMGSDILAALAEAQQQNKTKSNIFGFGYGSSGPTSAGCSAKGKVWSQQTAANIQEWVDWCNHVGTKLLDNSISIDDVLRKVIKYEIPKCRPPAVPLGIAWGPKILGRENTIDIRINGEIFDLYEVDISMLTFDDTSPIRFEVASDTQRAVYELVFANDTIKYVPVTGSAEVSTGRSDLSLSDWLDKEPPTIYLSNRAVIQYNLLAPLTQVEGAYSRDRIETWSWTGVDIQVESQGLMRDPVSIQKHVIDTLRPKGYDVIFDDDNSGEAADVIAIKLTPNTISFELFHCKFSGGPNPSYRIDDLYAVCGQAQKSVVWRSDVVELLKHLQRREGRRQDKYKATRFEVGDMAKLKELERRARSLDVEFSVAIVQPGLSQAVASSDQLDLLGATELFLSETYALPLRVIASP